MLSKEGFETAGQSLGKAAAPIIRPALPNLDRVMGNFDLISRREAPVTVVLDYRDFRDNFTAKEREALEKHLLAGHIKVILLGTDTRPGVFRFKPRYVQPWMKPFDASAVQVLAGQLGKGKVLYLSSQKVTSAEPLKKTIGPARERFIFLREMPELRSGEILTLGILHANADYFANPAYYRDALVPSPSGFWVPSSLEHYLLELSRQYLSSQELAVAA